MPVAGSKDAGFCQHCGLRIEVRLPPDPGRREFVKNATAATVGTVLGGLILRSIPGPVPAPPGRAVALQFHFGTPFPTPPAERAVALASNFGKPFPTPVNLTVQVADTIALADAVDVTVT